jgi:hypothetical protein
VLEAEVVLDAIAHSDGTRASLNELFRTRAFATGCSATFGFDARPGVSLVSE